MGSGERQARPVRRETRPARARPAEAEFSGPVVGQARALVSCLPSPYDNDVLAFQVTVDTRGEYAQSSSDA